MSASCDKPEHVGLLPLQHLVEHLRWGCTDQAQQAWLLEAVFAEHAHQVTARTREDTLRRAADYLRAKYGVTNRAAADLTRLAELETQGRSALWTEEQP